MTVYAQTERMRNWLFAVRASVRITYGGMMELKLNETEVKNILLKWAETEFPEAFNTVHFDAQYGGLRSVEFSQETPETPTPIKEAA